MQRRTRGGISVETVDATINNVLQLNYRAGWRHQTVLEVQRHASLHSLKPGSEEAPQRSSVCLIYVNESM